MEVTSALAASQAFTKSPLSFQQQKPTEDGIPRSFYDLEKPLITNLDDIDSQSSTSQSSSEQDQDQQSSSSQSSPPTEDQPPLSDFEKALLHPQPTSAPYPLPPAPTPISVLPLDLKTPDSFVPRDPALIRLTGVHPFNVEAPLTPLYDQGFLTTLNLHYVRNHGPVPQVHDADALSWSFTIEGLCSSPVTLTLADLISSRFEDEVVSYPVTLVCAGNRRKEQNQVRKSKGFSWGAAGLSTSLWTGLPLGHLLSLAGVDTRKGKFVHFEGADALPNGYYGTSVKLSHAMDPERGMMISWLMNGLPLHPDHGKPLRVIIPGMIGGRSVKWLKKMIISDKPSENWYHIYDNRVLPTTISPEESGNGTEEMVQVWKDERYAIYDLNTNSAVVYPQHEETVQIQDGATYELKGYAYAGGGKRVTRMEISLDQGKTWLLGNISYPEDLYRTETESRIYGGRLDLSQNGRDASFCWCFWSLALPVGTLAGASDIVVRAMDEAMMVQPRDMYWSVLGMMNNPWFRVVIHHDTTSNTLRFEHPTQPALQPGGWMERVKKSGGDLTNGFWGERQAGGETLTNPITSPPEKEISLTNPAISREVSLEELRSHDSEASPWFVLNGEVYDGTAFLEGHPGGAASIINAAAQDISDEFLAIHSENAKAMMPRYHIGTLTPSSLPLLSLPTPSSPPATPRPSFLHPKQWLPATLISKTKVSPNTKIFTFTLQHATQTLGLPVGQHLLVRLSSPETIIRAYTPISPGSLPTGTLSLLIKIYPPSPDSPSSGGKMTLALDALPLRSPVEFKGPVGKFLYLSPGLCSVNSKQRNVTKLVMICAGSGITPIFQVLRAILSSPPSLDPTKCLVLDGNRVEEDILCRDELDAMARGNKERMELVYSLSRPQASWQGRKGRMDRPFFESAVGKPDPEGKTLVLVCGPEGLERAIRETFTGRGGLGWDEGDVVFF
ncbi:hypothetical protein QC761_304260 [Podospora bellae-mahoneyi]|uniref:Nitrate reductase [NADPH] n=1 Tax=Podospora bellae-mahoneyi TaxID=2093777 RepID=A0ABR0FMW8_9PEZI|nr:hypothetical protein QC761_304260 [Podospora bellae-mahoneyi]